MQLIERECRVVLHVHSVGKYLARWASSINEPSCRA